jgi:hypothetical protein
MNNYSLPKPRLRKEQLTFLQKSNQKNVCFLTVASVCLIKWPLMLTQKLGGGFSQNSFFKYLHFFVLVCLNLTQTHTKKGK